jgi:hypothetical protein
MYPIIIAALVFGCVIAGALCGVAIRKRLPERHLDTDAKDVVKLATGLIATLSALVLGLLVATAKTSFDNKIGQVRLAAADMILLDNLLAQYGPETAPARKLVRANLNLMIDHIWRENKPEAEHSPRFEVTRQAEEFLQALYGLAPKNELQITLKGRIVQAASDLANVRLALFVQSGDTIQVPFLIILTLWLTMIFASFALLARLNILVGTVLLFSAVSVSAAVFLVMDLDQPFSGIVRIPDAPLRNVLPPLDP